MEYTLKEDGSVICTDRELDQAGVMYMIRSHKAIGHYWNKSGGAWGVITPEHVHQRRIKKEEVPAEVLLAAMLQ